VRLLTGEGVGGIAVIELAGDDAEEMLRGCFRPGGRARPSFEAGKIFYGHVVRGDELLDEVLACRAPTETGEPVFEVNCHGGILPARRVLEHLVQVGAGEGRAGDALPGRRLAKLEREILGQLIGARTQRAADALLVQLSGRLGAEVREIAALGATEEARRRTAKLRATYIYGRRLVEPATVVITGAPNVGKSTLANALVGRERSIVHHLPGTTRDAVSSVASLDGLPVVVVDTAGLRQATDEIEQLGVQKAIEKIGSSEVVVWVFDHSRRVTREELGYLKALGKRTVVPVVNKIDLAGPLDEKELGATVGSRVRRTCALTGRGIAELGKALFDLLLPGEAPARDAAVVTTARVATALDEAAARLSEGRAPGEVLADLLEG